MKHRSKEAMTSRKTERYAWAWRLLDFHLRLALVFAHRLPKHCYDRKELARVILQVRRQSLQAHRTRPLTFTRRCHDQHRENESGCLPDELVSGSIRWPETAVP